MTIELTKGVYWVGAVDWNIREFHSYSLHHGTTYNAYLIVDDKIALIDTVKRPFYDRMCQQIQEITSLNNIDYIVANHAEMDHSGALPLIIRDAPQATVITSQRFGELSLTKTFHHNWRILPVDETSEVSLGEKRLKFVPMPMLHWPDSMATYLVEDAILLPNDAFGQHYASSKRFDDEVDLDLVMALATKYYATILMPLGKLILQAIDKLKGLKVNMIAPSHGIIWRSRPQRIIDTYVSWAKGETKKKVLVIYDTMWGSTEKMAEAIVQGVSSEKIEVELYNLTVADRSDVIAQVLTAKALIIGSATLNNDILPNMAAFLTNLKGLKPSGKIGVAFGSYGWGGGAIKTIENTLKEMGIELVESSQSTQFVPDQETIKQCYELGRTIARKVAG